MNRKYILLLLAIITLCNACEKQVLIEEPEPQVGIPQVVEVSQRFVTLNYTISNKKYSSTGIIYASDKAAVEKDIATSIAKGIVEGENLKAVLQDLKPYITYYYRTFYVDYENKRRLGPVQEVTTAGVDLTIIPGSTNMFMVDKPETHRITFSGKNLSTVKSDYSVQASNLTFNVVEILRTADGNYNMVVDVTYMHATQLPLKIYYKNALIYSGTVTYVSTTAGLTNVIVKTSEVTQFEPIGAFNASFVYNALIYYWEGNRLKTYNIANDTWATLAPPPEDMYLLDGSSTGFNGEFYLGASAVVSDYQVFVYKPSTSTWRTIQLLDEQETENVNVGAVSIFEAGGKIYACFSKMNYNAAGFERYHIYVYDPAVDSRFKPFYNFPEGMRFLKMTSLNGMPYLVAEVQLWDGPLPYGRDTKLYKFNLADKTFQEEFSFAKTLEITTIFPFKNKVFMKDHIVMTAYDPVTKKAEGYTTQGTNPFLQPERRSNLLEINGDLYIFGPMSHIIQKIQFP